MIVPKFDIIDSDNILPERDWFSLMAEPFADEDVVGLSR
jgi:hypothetical protein